MGRSGTVIHTGTFLVGSVSSEKYDTDISYHGACVMAGKRTM